MASIASDSGTCRGQIINRNRKLKHMENFKSESITELVAAVTATILSIPNIDKNMTIGEGRFAYSGVSDKDVKDIVGKEMARNGLCLLPVDIDATEKAINYVDNGKQKQIITTFVKTKYILSHTSGQWIVLAGYGHGIDNQDKSAGKATTYAMKYAMLYSFAVATGSIDDTDKTHSNDLEVPPASKESKNPEQPEEPKKKVVTAANYENIKERVKSGQFKTAQYEVSHELSAGQIAELKLLEP